jgi:hypothetical protein
VYFCKKGCLLVSQLRVKSCCCWVCISFDRLFVVRQQINRGCRNSGSLYYQNIIFVCFFRQKNLTRLSFT